MLHKEESQYLNLIDNIVKTGDEKHDRTGVGTFAKFGTQLRFDISNRKIPVVSTRKLKPLDPIIEMLWFIAGDTDIAFLKENNINIWDSWVREDTKRYDNEGRLIGGSIGPGAYGAQWRNWEDTRIIDTSQLSKYLAFGYSFVAPLNDIQVSNGSKKCVITRNIDQLAAAIDMIKNSPDSRRIIVNAWNPARIEDQSLPPCHSWHQYYTYKLSHLQKIQMIDSLLEFKQLPTDKLLGLKEFVHTKPAFAHYAFFGSIIDEGSIDEAVQLFNLPSRGLKLHLNCRKH